MLRYKLLKCRKTFAQVLNKHIDIQAFLNREEAKDTKFLKYFFAFLRTFRCFTVKLFGFGLSELGEFEYYLKKITAP